jgi:hypothetical protein
MNKSTLERLAPLSGIAGVVLMLGGAFVSGLFMYLPEPDVLSGFLNNNAGRVATGGYLGTLSAFFLIWFAGSLWEHLRRYDEGSGRISALALGGGVAGGLTLGIGFSMLLVAVGRVGTAAGLDPVAAVTLYDIYGTISGLAGVGLGVMIVATAVGSLRHHAFPSWFGWISVLLALLLLSPAGYLGMYLAPLWIVVVGVWVYVRGRSA